jgi:phosphoribosylformimino-5-aminoimidazole carboxamide ribotide isomerase
VVVGSALASDERVAAAFFERFGDRIAAGIDTRNGKVAVQGWTHTSALRGPEFAQSMVRLGCKTLVYTDVGRDGTMTGPNYEELKQYLEIEGASVYASGGISGEQDLAKLSDAGVAGAIIGKAIYEGRVSLQEAVDTYQDRVEI